MKKSVFFALFVLGCAFSSVLKAEDFYVKGKIDGIKKGRLYLLAGASEEKTDTLGFCDFKRGKFALTASSVEPKMVQLVVEGYSGGFMWFAEPGVTYQSYLSEGEDYYIKGGALNDRYIAHMKRADSLGIVVAGLQQRYDEMRTAKRFRSASLVNDSLRREQEKLKELTITFLGDNDNVITAYTIYSNIVMRDAGLNETRRLYNTLGDGAKASQYGRIIEERIARLAKTEGGAQAPDFTLSDPQGIPVTMSGVKGKIKIIDFWASWCGPCRLNNPTLRRLYDEYHPKGLEIIGVSLDTNKAAWEKAIAKDGLCWVNVSSLKGWKCELVRLYNVTGVPAIFVLDENNNVIATGLKGDKLREFLEERLK